MAPTPRGLFNTVIPVAQLLSDQKPDVVPDGAVEAALAGPEVGRGARRDRKPGAHRMHLVDVKTIYGAGNIYRSRRARDEQSGAVAHRECQVHGEYMSNARRKDREATQQGLIPDGQTPVTDRMRQLGPVRGAVFGQWSEASATVHALLEAAARGMARKRWAWMGARSENEAYGFMVAQVRQRMGVVTARAMARLRLSRTAYVGVSRAMLAARPPRQPEQSQMQMLWGFEAFQVQNAHYRGA